MQSRLSSYAPFVRRSVHPTHTPHGVRTHTVGIVRHCLRTLQAVSAMSYAHTIPRNFHTATMRCLVLKWRLMAIRPRSRFPQALCPRVLRATRHVPSFSCEVTREIKSFFSRQRPTLCTRSLFDFAPRSTARRVSGTDVGHATRRRCV